ncbi:MAG: hypothetical protein CMD99_09560 [Gammaproteobacteria bacterium]|nr:hypothetical protein [Gammaproteobacteria bacterium]
MTRSRPIQEILKLARPAGYSFDCWIETDQHRMILNYMRDAVTGRSAELWIYGPLGVGKTHLALFVAEHFDCSYYDCGDIDPSRATELIEWLDIDKGLILDRIDYWLNDIEAESALFSWWKRKRNALVLVSEYSPHVDYQFALPDLRSRAHASMIFPLEGLDDEGINELFHCHLHNLDIEMSSDVLRFLAPRLPRNPSRLMNLVHSIDQESLRDQRKITIPWLKQFLFPQL